MKNISYSDGSMVPSVIVIWDDLSNEKPGYKRAFWTNEPDGNIGSPVIGYCSSNGSYRTIKEVVSDTIKYYPNETIYRNGKIVYKPLNH